MMLVLIAMLFATILSAAYLASRDNSPTIAENVGNTSALTWASHSGVNLAVSILETQSDWRNAHTNGMLLTGLAMGTATVDVELIDLHTYGPPTDSTTHVQIIATATQGGMTQRAEAVATVGTAEETLTPDLTDFAMYAGDSIDLKDTTMLTRWSSSPTADLGMPLWVGTHGTSPGAISVAAGAGAVNTILATTTSMSSSALSNLSSTLIGESPIVNNMPLPDPPSPSVADPDPHNPPADLDITGERVDITVDTRYDDLSADGASTIVLDGPVDLIVDDDAMITGGSSLIVREKSELIVFDDLTLDVASIMIGHSGELTIWVGGDLTITSSFIGEESASSYRAMRDGTATWIDSHKITFYSIPPEDETEQENEQEDNGVIGDLLNGVLGSPEPMLMSGPGSTASWTISTLAIVKGRLYAPNVDITLETGSVVYGHIVGYTIEITDDAALFYDTSLSPMNGFLNPPPSVLVDQWTLVSAAATLESLNDAAIQACADACGVVITITDTILTPVGFVSSLIPIGHGPPANSSPRTIPVDYEIRAVGIDVDDMEFGLTQRSKAQEIATNNAVDVSTVEVAEKDDIDDDAEDILSYVSHLNSTTFNPPGNPAEQALNEQLMNEASYAIEQAIEAGNYDYALTKSIWLRDTALVSFDGGDAMLTMEPYASELRAELNELITKLEAVR